MERSNWVPIREFKKLEAAMQERSRIIGIIAEREAKLLAENERLKADAERLRKLLKQSLRHVEQEGDDTLAAIIDTQVNTDASR